MAFFFFCRGWSGVGTAISKGGPFFGVGAVKIRNSYSIVITPYTTIDFENICKLRVIPLR